MLLRKEQKNIALKTKAFFQVLHSVVRKKQREKTHGFASNFNGLEHTLNSAATKIRRYLNN